MLVVEVNPMPDDDSDILKIDASIAGDMGLHSGDNLIIKAGSIEVPATVTIIASGRNGQSYIAAGVLKKLLLPTNQTVNLKLIQGQQMASIGPVIGILISKNKKLRRPPFSRQKYLLRRFISAGKNLGAIVYAFNPDGIDLANRRIEGYMPCQNDSTEITWKKSFFPFPDVVHNRILSRTTERTPTVRQAVEMTSLYGIKCFNPKFLNKWETHDILCKNPKLRKFLPETVKYESVEKLGSFLNKHQLVYLKPWHGSLGKDILRIKKEHGIYNYVYRQGKRTISGNWATPAEMAVNVQSFVGRRLYLMQQGLNLVTYAERVFDIRVLVQKNLCGCWVVSATVARIGKAGSPFPNIAAGGAALAIEQVWPEMFNREWQNSTAREQIDQLAEAVAVTLDEHLGNFGEMGLDVGVDKNNKIWLIEVNSKPSRKVFPPGDKVLKARSIRLPMEYAVYWAGFAKKNQNREQAND